MSLDPRILFVDQTGELGGAELCLADLAIRLRDRASVFLFEGGPFEELLKQNGVDVRLANQKAPKPSVSKQSRFSAYLLALPAVRSLIVDLARAAKGVDLLYANTAKAMMVTTLVALLLRKRFLFHLHDMIDAAHFSRLNRWLLVTAANLATGIVANSEATAAAYRRAGGQNRNLTVIPNGFEPELFYQDGTELEPAISSEGKSVVGMFGRITNWKGQKVLIQALAQVPEVTAVFVGAPLFTDEDRKYQQELVAQAKELGVSDRVQFAGFQRNILPYLKAVDLVAHCSISPEPFGRVIVEALLAGKPVIATRGGAPTEIIEDGVTGILVNPGESAELAAAIRNLLADPARANRMAAKGQEIVSKRYTLDGLLPEWIKFIDRSVSWKGTQQSSDSALLRHSGAGETGEQKTPGVACRLESRPTKAGVSL
ncbi:MAG TPA: glycosyltransferase [Chthoniobacterales bacterium]|nr:glycosyltransferase [Chthoniobacterales bacterium]